MKTNALQITSVIPGLAAAKAGIAIGDVLVEYDGKTTPTNIALGEAISAAVSETIIVRCRVGQVEKEFQVERGRLGIEAIEYGFDFELDDLVCAMQLTTAPSLEGYKVKKTVEIVTAECALGLNIFKDFFAGMSDIFGGRSETVQNSLRDARRKCLQELRKEAALVGANAIIAVDLDYSEFSGQGKSMLFLVASGTAVIVEPS